MPQFDLDHSPRRTPYRVPEGFFDTLEENIFAATVDAGKQQETAVRVTRSPRRWRAIVSAAAAIVLCAAIGLGIVTATRQTETIDVNQAFANLDSADQQYLIDTYNNERMLEAYLY